ncbi:ankyrin repeat domain-containing protein [Candidatus Babeliales bacterium]|nr:ankyrin repeat domain-containing protein [Candidatus Babeliales bacterium]
MIQKIIRTFFFTLALANTALPTGIQPLDAADQEGLTALHHAAINNHQNVIEEFVAASVSRDAQDNQGWTALHWAAQYGRSAFVAQLLAAGANPCIKNKQGCGAATIAGIYRYRRLMRRLLEAEEMWALAEEHMSH